MVTPGTLIDEGFLEGGSDNFVLGVHIDEPPSLSLHKSSNPPEHCHLGLAWLDISTGTFFTQQTTMQALSSALSRINPKEIVLDATLKGKEAKFPSMLTEESHITTYYETSSQSITPWNTLLEPHPCDTIAPTFTPEEVRAGKLLLEYVGDRLMGADLKLQAPVRYFETEVMSIDQIGRASCRERVF